MERKFLALLVVALAWAVPAWSQSQPDAPATKPPPFATTKVDGTDNVYVCRYGGHQAMFVVPVKGSLPQTPSVTAALMRSQRT